MNFGEMLEYLKKGEKMTRKAWDGDYIHLPSGNPSCIMISALGSEYSFTDDFCGSQDILADDWGFYNG